MKKQLAVMVMLCIALAGKSQGITFEKGSWKEVVAKAKATNKPIFIDVYTSWCGPCKNMSKNVFTQAEVGKEYNENYICYQIDAEKGDGIELAKRYEVKAYPTYLFLKADGSLFSRSLGSMEAEKFIAVSKTALADMNDPKPLSEMEKEYPNRKNDAAFLLEYINKREKFGKENAQLFDEYLALLPKEERVSDKTLEIYRKEKRNIDIHTLAYKNLQENINVITPMKRGVAYLYLMGCIDNTFRKACNDQNEKLLEEVLAANQKIPNKAMAKSKDELYMNYYQKTKNWDKYIPHAANYCEASLMTITADSITKMEKSMLLHFDESAIALKKIGYDSTQIAETKKSLEHALRNKNSEALNNIAWTFFERTNDPLLLNKALLWSGRSVELNEQNPMYIDTYANLLYKLGQKEKAIAEETKALNAALNAKEKTKFYEETLKKMKAGEKTWK